MTRKGFIGVGELAADEVYIRTGEDIKHLKSIAGGTVWNVFSHIAGEFDTLAIATCGDDIGGSESIRELESYGVDVRYIKKTLKNTHKIHIIINDPDNSEYEDVESSFTNPITKKDEEYICDCNWIKEYNTESFFEYNEAIVMTDKFDKNYLKFIFELKEKYNYKIAIDIGHAIMVDNLNNVEVKEILSKIDYLQINQKMSDYFYERKLDLQDIMSYSDMKLITVTKGSKGAEFIYKKNDSIQVDKFDIEEPAKIVDPTGAGDAFFATTLKSIMREGLDSEINNEILEGIFKEAIINTSEIVGIIGARKAIDDVGLNL